MHRKESRKESRRIIPLGYKLGAVCLLALTTKAGVTDEIAIAAYDTTVDIVSVVGEVTGYSNQTDVVGTGSDMQVIVTIAPSAPVPEQVVSLENVPMAAPQETEPSEDCIGGTYDGWYFDPRADEIIDTITQYTEDQRTFLKFSLRAVCEVVRQGNQINPSVEYVKSSVESNSGADSLSPYNNFHGHKAGKGDKFVEVWTREDFGQGIVRVKQKFTVYDTPTGSYEDSADMIQRLPWYEDAVACRYNNRNYALALQHQLNPVTCAIEKYQGQKGVLSYATQGSKPGEVEYEDILANRAEFLNVDQYIYRP